MISPVMRLIIRIFLITSFSLCEYCDFHHFRFYCLYAQVAEGVSTAGAVIALAQKYNVKMPVLTAVARIIDNELTPKKAVYELMNLPQVFTRNQYTNDLHKWPACDILSEFGDSATVLVR